MSLSLHNSIIVLSCNCIRGDFFVGVETKDVLSFFAFDPAEKCANSAVCSEFSAKGERGACFGSAVGKERH